MAVTAKLDLYREHKQEYITPKKPVLVRIKPAQYLTTSGRGAPGGESFQAKVGALYGVAFALKMEMKFAGRDYKVCHLEGLWWGSGDNPDFSLDSPDTWNWKLLIRVPQFIKSKDVEKTVAKLIEKGKISQVSEVRLERIAEGLCVQMLHVGPYAGEGKTICEMMKHAASEGLSFDGLHHEIYLSDPRRVTPERLRTILRHPVR